MPYIKVETNVEIAGGKAGNVLAKLSEAVAKVTGKPEQYVQVGLVGDVAMLMAGTDAPTAHVAVRGIGFAESQAEPMSGAVSGVLAAALGIPAKRVYLTFDSYSGTMWGVGGSTFA